MISDKSDTPSASPDVKTVTVTRVDHNKCMPSYLMNLGGSVRINPTGVAILCGVIILLVYFNSGGGGAALSGRPGGAASSQTVSLKELLSVAISVAEAGGREVVAVRKEADIGEFVVCFASHHSIFGVT